MSASDPRLPQPMEVGVHGRVVFPNGLPRGWTEVASGPALSGDCDLVWDKSSGVLLDNPKWEIVVGQSFIQDSTYGIYRPWPKFDLDLAMQGSRSLFRAAPAAPDGWEILAEEDNLFRGDMILREDGSIRPVNPSALQSARTPVPARRAIGGVDTVSPYARTGESVRVLAVIRHPAVHVILGEGMSMRAGLLVDRLFETPIHTAKPRPKVVLPKVVLPKSIHSIPLPLP